MSFDASPARLESRNPTTGELVDAVVRADAAAIEAAVRDAASIQPAWAELRPSDRARYMRRAAQVTIDAMGELAELIAREAGRPRSEAAAAELLPTVDALHWIADRGPRLLRDERVRPRQLYLLGKRHRHVREPLGVVAVVSSPARPWLEPLIQAAVALMCGNGVVLNPAPETPLVGARVERALVRAGVPEGLVAVVHGDGEVADALAAADGVEKVFLSGDAETGRRVEAACARRGKDAVLELGGKDPQLVLADARLDETVAGTLWGAFAGGGQPSGSIERIYVAEERFEPYVERLVAKARALRVGDPLDAATEIGPLVSPERAEHLAALVEEALAGGTELRCGGRAPVERLGPAFFSPTVLTGVTPGTRIAREPVPGPVVTVTPVADEDEAIARANDSPWALGASIWTRDRVHGERVARRLDAGMVWVNDHRYSYGAVESAWGGRGASGHGRVHGDPGFRECFEIKLVGADSGRAARPWWPPYDASLGRAAEAGARILYGRDEQRWPALRSGARPLARTGLRTLRAALRR
jgi:acyl-CoA reductase-like NAD-dependent aldehyde dehydrogenase